jgi:hypothetical protein
VDNFAGRNRRIGSIVRGAARAADQEESMQRGAATRRARSVALDPRLLIGLALVVGSVAGVLAIVSAADETVQVYAAGQSLAPGDRIDVRDLEPVDVRLDDAGTLYLVPGDVPSAGVVVSRAIDEGELVPASAVGSADGLRLTSVVLDVGGTLAASVTAGSTVDVWAAREAESGAFGPPVVIVSGATVVRLVESESIVAGGQTTGVEILVPKSKVARVLEAMANEDVLSIVPATLPARG